MNPQALPRSLCSLVRTLRNLKHAVLRSTGQQMCRLIRTNNYCCINPQNQKTNTTEHTITTLEDYPNIVRHPEKKEPERDPNLENYPYAFRNPRTLNPALHPTPFQARSRPPFASLNFVETRNKKPRTHFYKPTCNCGWPGCHTAR